MAAIPSLNYTIAHSLSSLGARCRNHGLVVAGLLVTIATVGCQRSDHPKMVRARGTVLYNGQPLEGAVVSFVGPGGRPSAGDTDAEGRFQLSAWKPGDGAVLGEHMVTITKYAKPSFEPEKTPDGSFMFKSAEKEIAYYNTPSVLPARYGNQRQSVLKATVTEDGPNDFKFELKD